METKVKENGTAVNNDKNKPAQFVSGNPVNKDSAKQPESKPAAEQVKEAPKAPKAQEQPKADPAKPVRNLEETIKFLEQLHDLKVKRDKFLATIANLDEFEIDLKKEAEETNSNYYQGCSLTIEDDAHRKFVTKNPIIIWSVAQQITSICEGRLAELEAKLVITA